MTKAPDSNAKTFVVDVDPVAMSRVGVFTVTSGLDAGRVLPIPKGTMVTFGRSTDCTYPFEDPSLSREHAIVMRVGNDYTLKDGGSTNGTFVNDVRVPTTAVLRDGDRLQLGLHTMLRFALVSADEEAALRRVYDAAIKDGLTGVYNRKYLEERMLSELAFAARHQTLLSVIIIDVDHFKKVNDTFGHLAGDAVLRNVARVFGGGMRPEDVVARYGGEEFVVVLRGIPLQEAAVVAERLRREVEASVVDFEGQPIRVTSSAGVACSNEFQSADKTALLGAADGRLYKAKSSGRNRVVAF